MTYTVKVQNFIEGDSNLQNPENGNSSEPNQFKFIKEKKKKTPLTLFPYQLNEKTVMREGRSPRMAAVAVLLAVVVSAAEARPTECEEGSEGE